MKIVIVDYGMGNLGSIYNAIAYLGFDAVITGNPDIVKTADKLILPGVGAFKDAMQCINKKELSSVIKDFVNLGKPFLGVCLGLQLIFTESQEGGIFKGLDLIRGSVNRFSGKTKDGLTLKVPHIGWNNVEWTKMAKECKIVKNIPGRSWFYFVHSYYAVPEDSGTIVGASNYGEAFPSVVFKDNIYAVQFHPEKSQQCGLKMLENFIRL